MNDLKAPGATTSGPTVSDLGDLAPDLEGLFRDLDPLIRAGRTGVPALERTLRGREPVFEAMHVFLPELNPILSYFNFHQTTVAGVHHQRRRRPGGRLRHRPARPDPGRHHERFAQLPGVPDGSEPPDWARGNAYLHPNSLMRALKLGMFESFDCPGGERKYAKDALEPGQDHDDKRAPCFELPPSLYDGKTSRVPAPRVCSAAREPEGQ